MDAEFIDFVLSMVVTMSATYAILRFDESRLTEAQLERAWPTASRNAAVLAFSPICLVIHFAKTRASILGGLMGVTAAALVMGLNVGLALLVDTIMSH